MSNSYVFLWASVVLRSSHSLVVQEIHVGFIYIFVAIDVNYLYVIPFFLQETLHPQLKYLPKFVYTRETRAMGLHPGLNQVIPEWKCM